MSTTSFLANSESDHEQVRRWQLPVGIATTLVAFTLCVLGAHDNTERAMEFAWLVIAAGLIFGFVVPRGLRHESAGGRAIALGVLGLLLVVPAFWSGLPALLGVAAVMLGYAGKRAVTGSGRAIAGLVLGLLTVMAYVAIYASDLAALS